MLDPLTNALILIGVLILFALMAWVGWYVSRPRWTIALAAEDYHRFRQGDVLLMANGMRARVVRLEEGATATIRPV